MTSTALPRPLIGGVAGRLASRLGVDPAYVRALFVVGCLFWGASLGAYLAAWAFWKPEARSQAEITEGQQAGLALAVVGSLLALRSLGIWPGDSLVWPVTAIAFGLAFLSARDDASLARFLQPGPTRIRAMVGVVLLLGGLDLGFSSIGVLARLGNVFLAVLVVGVGLTLVFGPWLYRLGQNLVDERRERIRSEERSEVAAHLHDSVLQTLALIQRTDDPRRMLTLARAQERELRRWLYDRSPADGLDRLSTALQAAADRVESEYQVPIEVVVVGDCALNEPTRAVSSAAAEAMTNAARHSGAGTVSVYMEVGDDRVEVWVSDQGKGFDPDNVPSDRRGLADSIAGRMARFGGTARIESEIGEGTEISLLLPLETKT